MSDSYLLPLAAFLTGPKGHLGLHVAETVVDSLFKGESNLPVSGNLGDDGRHEPTLRGHADAVDLGRGLHAPVVGVVCPHVRQTFAERHVLNSEPAGAFCKALFIRHDHG